jgi:uncharacterized protein (DUF697 family)
MQPDVRRLTNRHAAITAVASFILQPIPAADELVVVPIHYYFAASLTRKRGAKVMSAPWGKVQKIIWGGAVARLFANFTIGLVPVAGAFSNAITAVALTEYLARYLDDALDHPGEPPPDVTLRELRALFAGLRKRPAAEVATA